MKIKILSVEEKNGSLRVKVSSDYGIDDLGLSLESARVDPVTGQPLWLWEVKDLMNRKYKDAVRPKGEDLVGKEIETND
jgi:hypothetical protein